MLDGNEALLLIISLQTPVVMVNQPDVEGNSSIRHILPNWVRASPFLPYGRGAMHVKARNFSFCTARDY